MFQEWLKDYEKLKEENNMSEEEIIKNIEDMLLHAETNLLDYEALALQGLLDLYNKEKLNTLNLSEQLNKEKEKNKKIEETVKKGMKNLWVDTCAEDAGKYSAYMSISRILEE